MDVSATRRAPASPAWRRLPARPPGLAVLIVSGDPSVRAIAMRELENSGYVVMCAAHSGHALLACLTRGRIDLAFIEATLEDMPGAELACTLAPPPPRTASRVPCSRRHTRGAGRRRPAAHRREARRGARSAYFDGILKNESSAVTSNSTVSSVVDAVTLPLTSCRMLNGIILPPTSR